MKFMRLIAPLLLLFISSCAAPNPEKEAIQRLIGKYNFAIISAYKDLNIESLISAASDAEIKKVKTIINAYLDDGEIMHAELLNLTFKDINIKAASAEARTSEDWNTKWVDVKTGEIKEPLKKIHYEMVYHLIKKDGKWLVEKVLDVGKGG